MEIDGRRRVGERVQGRRRVDGGGGGVGRRRPLRDRGTTRMKMRTRMWVRSSERRERGEFAEGRCLSWILTRRVMEVDRVGVEVGREGARTMEVVAKWSERNVAMEVVCGRGRKRRERPARLNPDPVFSTSATTTRCPVRANASSIN